MKTRTEILHEAYTTNRDEWCLEGFTAEQWRNIAVEREERHKPGSECAWRIAEILYELGKSQQGKKGMR